MQHEEHHDLHHQATSVNLRPKKPATPRFGTDCSLLGCVLWEGGFAEDASTTGVRTGVVPPIAATSCTAPALWHDFGSTSRQHRKDSAGPQSGLGNAKRRSGWDGGESKASVGTAHISVRSLPIVMVTAVKRVECAMHSQR